MNMQLIAKQRKELGKKNRKLRQQGILPAVIYGYKIKNQPISVSYKDFEKIYKIVGKNTFIDLLLDNQTMKVLIYNVSRHPLSNQFLSVDFYQPRLVKNIYEIQIESLPTSLPHEIKVDISKLKTFEDTIKISDLVLPKDVKILADNNEIIALVVPPRSDEELAELGKETIENVEAVKVIKEKKEEKIESKEEKEVQNK